MPNSNKATGKKDATVYNTPPTATQSRIIANILSSFGNDIAIDPADIDIDYVAPTDDIIAALTNNAPQTDAPKPEVIAPPTPAVIADTIYGMGDAVIKLRPGFEVILHAEIAKGPGTVDELVARMLASGEFMRVAPKAATNRPAKPTKFLCKLWATLGVLTTA